MKRYRIAIFAIFLLAVQGCKKLLEVETVSSINSSSYWKAEGDVKAYMTGIYSELRDLMNSTLHFEDRGDAFVAGLEGSVSAAWQQNLTPQNAPNWLDHYNAIYHCNLLLKYAPQITFTQQANKNRYMAEALTVRAYIYFLLMQSWNNVPLILAPIESDQSEFPERAPATEVAAQVLKDLNDAISLFPEEGFTSKTKMSKPAAYAIKADVFLWRNKVLKGQPADLDSALAAVQKPLDQTTLLANFGDIFSSTNKKNSEIVFSIAFLLREKSDQYGSRMKPRDIFVANASNVDSLAFAKNGARSVYAPSPQIQAAFDEHPADLRKKYSIIKALNPNGSIIGVFDNKYRGTKYIDDRYYDDDIVVYRNGGLLLTKAEILAAMNRSGDAVTELNKVKSRAGIGNYAGATDKVTMEREILKERSRELFFELTRWHDLVRFHYGGSVNIYNTVPNLNGKSVPLFFPIPQAQIDINSKLTQTEGY